MPENTSIITATFTYQNALYGVENRHILRSDDEGTTWTVAFTFTNNSHAFTNFVEIEGQLFGLYRDLCLMCEVSPENFSCEPLNTEELSSQEIIYLTKFSNQAVMLTSAGIYVRDWESFISVE